MSTVELFEDDLMRKVLARLAVYATESYDGSLTFFLIDKKSQEIGVHSTTVLTELKFEKVPQISTTRDFLSGVKLKVKY